MALATHLCLSSIPALCSPALSSGSNSNRTARISHSSASSAFRRKDVGKKLYHTGTSKIISVRGNKQREWVLLASGEEEVASTEEKAVAADGTGTKTMEQNSSGPPVLTVLAGLVVLAGFLWVVGSLLLWFIGLFFR